MSVIVTLDDETGAYLTRIAADQGRVPDEVAAWILTSDLQRERAIDTELAARLNTLDNDRAAGQSLFCARPGYGRMEP